MPSTHRTSRQPTRRKLLIIVACGFLVALIGVSGFLFGSWLRNQDRVVEQNPTDTQVDDQPTGDNGQTAELPTECSNIYSAQMFDYLSGTDLPLNDPSVAMTRSSIEDRVIAVIEARLSLRCSWGAAGEVGLTTNVVEITQQDRATLEGELNAAGFSCTPSDITGIICRKSQQWDTGSNGETHAMLDGLWVATRWVNFGPDGYTEDIIATITGR